VQKYSGSCLCAEVRFEIDGEFERFYLCHCDYCRKDTGSVHASNLFSTRATLRWLSGEDKVTHFTLPGSRHSRAFCSICGSPVPQLQLDGGLLAVPAGGLDSEVLLKPDAHIFVDSRPAWDQALDLVPSMRGLPS
jgi:hypothetical protein